jgi:hypothetical protein
MRAPGFREIAGLRRCGDDNGAGRPMRKSTDQMLRQLYHSPRNPEIDEGKSRFAALYDFVTSRHGWINSIPGDTEVMLECLPGSTLPDDFRGLGHHVREAGEGERILAAAVTERFWAATPSTMPMACRSRAPASPNRYKSSALLNRVSGIAKGLPRMLPESIAVSISPLSTRMICLSSHADAAAFNAEPGEGQLRPGERVLIDDGSCPAGQIKEVMGGNNRKYRTTTKRPGSVRTIHCVPH